MSKVPRPPAPCFSRGPATVFARFTLRLHAPLRAAQLGKNAGRLNRIAPGFGLGSFSIKSVHGSPSWYVLDAATKPTCILRVTTRRPSSLGTKTPP